MKNFLLLLTALTVCCMNACTLEVKTNTGSTSSDSKIRNGIQIQESGLKVQQAFLSLEQDGTLVPENNKVQVGQKVVLHLVTDGWTEENGLIFPEASEKIATNEGDVLVDEAALFQTVLPNGTAVENKNRLTLTAVITQLDKLHDYYLVSFKMWDKKSNKSFSGSYKLYI